MPTRRFTLIVEGPDLQAERVIDALFQAGCDDATVGRTDGVQYIEFDREAKSLLQAVSSALHDVENVEGVQITRVF
ncbi:MAG: hypothetical protein OXI49_18135 [Acidobacteriota bacterium]|nr:hypothetical protein [Acidobacteriota bacterium]